MHPILENFIPTAQMIAQTFGPDCEVVLHDLSIPQNSVVYAVNGHVTGRRVGQSFDHLITHVLLSRNYAGGFVSNYYFTTEDGRLIKSSTALIRDGEGKVAGALCVNVDTTRATQAIGWLLQSLPGCPGLPGAPGREGAGDLPPDHILGIADDLIARLIGERAPGGMSREEKVELVRFMEGKGLFLIKGAIDKVAERLGISKVTVYSYLDEVKSKKGQDPA